MNAGEKSIETKKNQLLTFSKKEVIGEVGNTNLDHLKEFLPDGTTLTKEEAITLKSYLSNVTHGFYARTPMRCLGNDECPYRLSCPLAEMDKAPIGKKCPLEQFQMEKWLVQYVEDLEVDTNSKTEMALIYELVKYDILEGRAMDYLSVNPSIVQEYKSMPSKQGSTIIKIEEENKAFGVIEKSTNKRLKLLEALVATRESKIRNSDLRDKDPAQYIKNALAKVEEIVSTAKSANIINVESS